MVKSPFHWAGTVACYFSLRLGGLLPFSTSLALPLLLLFFFSSRAPSLFLLLGSCYFRICAVIITHHYGSNRDMHEKPASVRSEEGGRGGGGGEERERERKKSIEEGKDMWQLRLSEWAVSAEGAGPGVGCAVRYSLSPLIRKCQSDYAANHFQAEGKKYKKNNKAS